MSEQSINPNHPKTPRGTSKRQTLSRERLEKRRKIDREAQRAVRERTKNHISALQRTIDSFLQNEGDGQVENLAQQLREEREENSRMKKLLLGIEKMIHAAAITGSEPVTTCEATSSGKRDSMPSEIVEDGSNSDASFGFCLNIDGSATSQQPSCSDKQNFFSDLASVSAILDFLPAQRDLSITATEILPSSTGMSPPNFAYPWNYLTVSVSNACSASSSATEPIWKQVNDGLSRAPSLKTVIPSANLETDADICIRAVLYGWPSAEQQHDLDVGWQILRQIDENVFSLCGIVERIAIMRVMRLILLRDANPNQDLKSLPLYMASRPTQRLIQHPKIIDYFTWPELRDHLILAPQKYPPDQMARLIPANVRFSWPYPLSALYTTNRMTGLYSFSNSFDARFQDIHSWMLCSDFFKEFPELNGVASICAPYAGMIRSIPQMKNSRVWNSKHAESRRAESSLLRPFSNNNRLGIQDEDNECVDSGISCSFANDNGSSLPDVNEIWADSGTLFDSAYSSRLNMQDEHNMWADGATLNGFANGNGSNIQVDNIEFLQLFCGQQSG